ncbi:hypothetical protein Dimus_015722, partial [Dionaea muscipula]
KGMYCTLVSLAALMGIPKYLKGSPPIMKPVNCLISSAKWSSTAAHNRLDLTLFTLSPEQEAKCCRHSMISLTAEPILSIYLDM